MSIRRAGMTLVELLAVIAVLGLLLATLIPAVQRGRQEAMALTCKNNLRSAGLEMLVTLEHSQFPEDLESLRKQFRVADSRQTQLHITPVGCPGCSPPLPQLPPGLQSMLDAAKSVGGNQGAAEAPAVEEAAGDGLTLPSQGSTFAARTSLDYLGVWGCPLAAENPAFALDPQNEPPKRSYGVFAVNLGKSLRSVSDVLMADSDFTLIGYPSELAVKRHGTGVHVFYKDGHVALTSWEELVEDPQLANTAWQSGVLQPTR